MTIFKKILFISLILILWGPNVFSLPLELQGQLSGWMTINPDPSFETQIGLRYIPDLSIEKTFYEKYLIDADIIYQDLNYRGWINGITWGEYRPRCNN